MVIGASRHSEPSSIRLLVLDIDGVMTDGTALLDSSGQEMKRIHFRDLDAITRAQRQGLEVVLVTGEAGTMTQTLARRFGVQEVLTGAKDKAAALLELAEARGVLMDQICYVGDSERDLPAMKLVGLSLAPADAAPRVRLAAGLLLGSNGGEGAVAEAISLLLPAGTEEVTVKPTWKEAGLEWRSYAAAHIEAVVQENILAHQQLLENSIPVLVDIAGILSQAIQAGQKILLFGNGGSAADAQHVAADLLGSFSQHRPHWPAIALTTDTSVLTAIANDQGFEQVFAVQVQALAQPGDVVVGISTSGRSRNVLLGLEAGRKLGAFPIGFTGSDPGPLLDSVDLCFCAPAKITQRAQELHIVAWHAILDLIEYSTRR